ncbi:MAG: hypothetical protein SGARI_008191 [Bacillariaceae sp.]
MAQQSASEEKPLKNVKIGIPDAFSVAECPPEIAEAWLLTAQRLEQHGGAQIIPIDASQISPTIIQNALSAYYVLTSAEASSNLSRYDGFRYGRSAGAYNNNCSNNSVFSDEYTPLEQQYATARSEGFGQEVARRILSQQLETALQDSVDAILIPTVLSLPPPSDDNAMDSTAMFANDVMTTPASLAGLPAMSIPVAIPDDVGDSPFQSCGMQLIGGRLGEAVLLQCAQVLEESNE